MQLNADRKPYNGEDWNSYIQQLTHATPFLQAYNNQP